METGEGGRKPFGTYTMNGYIIPSAISFVFLVFILIYLWRQRTEFHSLLPFSLAVILLAVGRFTDFTLESSLEKMSTAIGVQQSFDLFLNNIGNICDAIGALFLVYGFIRTIEHQKQIRRRIEDLEKLLPLCAWCKKYRTESGEWKPIEAYLRQSASITITHGICPECAAREMSEARSNRRG